METTENTEEKRKLQAFLRGLRGLKCSIAATRKAKQRRASQVICAREGAPVLECGIPSHEKPS
jgi:hypothetical protein